MSHCFNALPNLDT